MDATIRREPGLVRVKVERGQRGGYAWELTCELPIDELGPQAAFARAAEELKAAEAVVKAHFREDPA